MRFFLWLVRKDLAVFFSDRQGAVMTVLLPITLASLLGMLFAGGGQASPLHLLVVVQDPDPAVGRFVAAIEGSESFEAERVDEATARRRLAEGKASLALLLPPGSGEALRPTALFLGKRRRAQLLYDPADRIEASLAAGLLTQLAVETVMQTLSTRAQVGALFEDLQKEIDPGEDETLRDFFAAGRAFGEATPVPKDETASRSSPAEAGNRSEKAPEPGGLRPPLELETHAVEAAGVRSRFNSYAHEFAGMLLLFLLFAAQARAKGFAAERSSGVLTRLRLGAGPEWVIPLGMGAAAAVIALLASAVVYAVGLFVFDVEVLGSVLGFIGVLLAQAIFVGAFAVLLAGLGRTQEQIGTLGTFLVLALSAGGGAMFPAFLFPPWLRTLALALPTYWATEGLAAMTWRGLSLAHALPSIGALLLSAALATAIGLWRLRLDA